MDSRQRAIDATAALLWRQGLRATGINQIVEESKSPRGSIYFHFPGGKEELAAAALRSAGAVMTANIRGALAHRDVRTAVKRFVLSYAKEMRESDFQHGCPIATVALEAASASPAIREVCAGVFAEWDALLVARLERDGIRGKKARKLGAVILSALEGAMILCRTHRTTEPLEWVAEHLTATLTAAAAPR
ncbi:MAG: TetR/AcrR family transcriptional regulator [Deltaproteobacteria bacterium]|nr:TetR/AcrR family transcriptional regulator [Deltaproteobacteria bacterium]